MLDMTLCALLLSWSVWAGDCILHDGFVSWKDKRKDANASVLVYCISMLSLFERSVPLRSVRHGCRFCLPVETRQ